MEPVASSRVPQNVEPHWYICAYPNIERSKRREVRTEKCYDSVVSRTDKRGETLSIVGSEMIFFEHSVGSMSDADESRRLVD